MATVVLETSAALAWLTEEPESTEVDKIIQAAERQKIRIVMSDFAWQEIDPSRQHDPGKMARLQQIAGVLPKVARLGEWVLGQDMLGHDSSHEIERALPSQVRRSRPDIEQFLSCARAGASFFVTNDKKFFSASARANVHRRFRFEVGKASDCLIWLRQQGII